MKIDDLCPADIRAKKLTLTAASKTTPRAFKPIAVQIDYSGAGTAGVELPLIMEVRGPSSSSYVRREFRYQRPVQLVFTPREGGQHCVMLREAFHNRWWGSLKVDVEATARRLDIESALSVSAEFTSHAEGAVLYATVATTISGTWHVDVAPTPTGHLYLGDPDEGGRDLGAVTIVASTPTEGTWSLALPETTGISVSDAGDKTLYLRLETGVGRHTTTLDVTVYHPATEVGVLSCVQHDLGGVYVDGAGDLPAISSADWAKTNVTEASPVITETGIDNNHMLSIGLLTYGVIAGPMTSVLDVARLVGARNVGVYRYGGVDGVDVDLGTGEATWHGSAYGTVTTLGGGKWRITITTAETGIGLHVYMLSGTAKSYLGDGASSISVEPYDLTQRVLETWEDQSAAGHNLTSSGGERPFAYSGSAWDTDAGYLMYGAQSIGSDNLAAWHLSGNDTACSIVTVYKRTSSTGDQPLHGAWSSTGNAYHRNNLYDGGAAVCGRRDDAGTTATNVTGTADSSDEWHCTVDMLDATQRRTLRRDGVQIHSMIQNVGVSTYDRYKVGASKTAYLTGRVKFHGVYSGGLSTDVIARISAWMSAKYGVSA